HVDVGVGVVQLEVTLADLEGGDVRVGLDADAVVEEGGVDLFLAQDSEQGRAEAGDAVVEGERDRVGAGVVQLGVLPGADRRAGGDSHHGEPVAYRTLSTKDKFVTGTIIGA